jgi:hypothetical protein
MAGAARMPKTMQYWVKWDDDDVFAMLCRNVRREQVGKNAPIAGKNLAICFYQPSWENNKAVTIGCSSPSANAHSERIAFDALASVLDSANKTAKLLAIYTERAPCEIGPGMANCDGYLYEQFDKFTTGGKLGSGTLEIPLGILTPVYYSFPYPSGGKIELEDVLNGHQLLGITDDPTDNETMTLKEFFLELGKKDRQEINMVLKSFEKKKK